MDPISDKIKGVIEARNLNKSKFCEQIGMARDYVYKLSDETIKVATLIRISEVLEIPIVDFFTEKNKKSDTLIVEDPKSEYGNKDMELKILKERLKSSEEINQSLKEQIALYKQVLGKK